MILNKLVDFYDRLEADPSSDVAPIGFSRQKISFAVVLKTDGSLHAFEERKIEGEKRAIPERMVVPGQAKPPGSGINPCFLWDNAAYMLGYKPEDPKPARTLQAFEAFRDRHLALVDEIDDDHFRAVCQFLKSWSPDEANNHPELADIAGSFGVFRVSTAGEHQFVHDRPAVMEYWARQISVVGDDQISAPSLISGSRQPIARLHEPKIKGVMGAQSAGAALVSFNLGAFESYGKSQSYNAPVGETDAFKYCTALNRLTGDNRRSVRVGDTTVVFWAEKPATRDEIPFEGWFGNAIDLRAELANKADDEQSVDAARDFFLKLRRAVDGSRVEDADVPFYVLGLSPNASRLSIRFWLVGTVQDFAERLARHIADLEIGGEPPNARPLSIKRILDQTARERKDVQPLLAGAVLHAVLTGAPYPHSLLTSIIRRIRADREVWHARAAVIKAYLNRLHRTPERGKETIDVTLNKDHPRTAYHLGRLFAFLERIQLDASKRGNKELEKTIVDSHVSRASSAPGSVFPRLLSLNRHHMAKLPTNTQEARERRCRTRFYYEPRLDAVLAKIDGFSSHHSLEEQGFFFIGYYHQRQDFFTSKTNTDGDAVSTEE